MSMCIIIKYSLKAAFIYFFNSIMANCEMEIERTEYHEKVSSDRVTYLQYFLVWRDKSETVYQY